MKLEISVLTKIVLTSIFLFGCASKAQIPLDTTKVYESEGQKFQLQVLTNQKDVIWGFDFLSDGRILFTERSGALKVLDSKTGSVTPVSGLPKVWADGQGGLLDVRVHPSKKSEIYFTYTEPVGDGATTALAKASLSGSQLAGVKKLFSAHKPSANEIHFGSRIEFDGKGHVFVSVGDRKERSHVQSLGYHTGKIMRINEDGSVPKDNPFIKVKGARPEIWSLGHRNPQGLTRHPETGELWEAEMGPRGGDELNLIKAGKNYGWPVVTYGREYWGPKIGEGTSKPGMEDPVVYWVPSISPSGITFYNGDVFPKWKGNAFIGTLSGSHLRRLIFVNGRVIRRELLFKGLNLRFRNVRPGPDGLLYFSTDDGKIVRIKPAG